MDYGYNHWNMIYLHVQSPDGVIYTVAEIAHRKHLPAEIAADFKRRVASFGWSLNSLDAVLVGSDVFNRTGASEKSVGEQYKALGIRLEAAETGPGSRVDGAHHITKLLGKAERNIPPRWLVFENCEQLIETMGYLEKDPNRPEDVKKVDADDDGQGGDDAYDAARYGLYRKRITPITAGVSSYV